jgi:hypothetical protein
MMPPPKELNEPGTGNRAKVGKNHHTKTYVCSRAEFLHEGGVISN